MSNVAESWRHYEQANVAALESNVPSFKALATAGRAFVLVDVGESATAVELLGTACETAKRTCSPLLRSWLAAAHGETLAANGQRNECLHAFDTAETLLPDDTADPDGPYIALDSVHLARWRGHALARCANPDAVDVLTGALNRLDPTFIRAETALRVDLATALAALDERDEARAQAEHAGRLATQIGSMRQRRRMETLVGVLQGPA